MKCRLIYRFQQHVQRFGFGGPRFIIRKNNYYGMFDLLYLSKNVYGVLISVGFVSRSVSGTAYYEVDSHHELPVTFLSLTSCSPRFRIIEIAIRIGYIRDNACCRYAPRFWSTVYSKHDRCTGAPVSSIQTSASYMTAVVTSDVTPDYERSIGPVQTRYIQKSSSIQK